MSFYPLDPEELSPSTPASPAPQRASLPGDPFPWAPDPTPPAASPADDESEPLFPPDLGAVD